LRYIKTASGRVIITSEIGAVPVDPHEIRYDGQLEPGGMIIADLTTGALISPESTTDWIVDRTGLNFKTLSTVDLLPIVNSQPGQPLSTRALNAFGWTRERIRYVHEMVKGAKEPIHILGSTASFTKSWRWSPTPPSIPYVKVVRSTPPSISADPLS
jgi:hypothetical protein